MLLIVLALLPILAHMAFAKVICYKSPTSPSQIPDLTDCHELIEDIFAISKLEGDEQFRWSRKPNLGPGSRKLPYAFTAPSMNNDCEILVDTMKDDQEDMVSAYAVGLTARDIVRFCLEPKAGKGATIGAGAIGKKRVLVVALLKRIPEPLGGNGIVRSSNRTDARWQLPGHGSSPYASLLEDVTF